MFEAHMFIGPMFSGKSTELLRQVSRYVAIGKSVLVINHKNDTRTGDSIKTHDNLKHKALKTDKLMDLQKKKKELTKEEEKQAPSGLTQNNVFVGSTTDLQRMLLDNNKSEVIDVNTDE